MADKPDLFMAQSIVNGAKDMLKGTTGDTRTAILQTIAQAQEVIDSYAANKKNIENQSKVKDLSGKLQNLYDERDAVKITKKSDPNALKNIDQKIKEISESITKFGGTPTPYPSDFTIPKMGQKPGSKDVVDNKPTAIPSGAKVQVDGSVVDSKGKVIGTSKDGVNFTPSTPSKPSVPSKPSTPSTPSATPSTIDLGGGLKIAADPQELWISYLKQAFSTIDDPKAKAQIDAIFKQASAPGSGWTEQTFIDHLNQVPWWTAQQPSLKNFFLLTHDPSQKGFLAEQLRNKTAGIQASLAGLGIEINNVDPATGKIIDNSSVVNGIAMEAIKNNWGADSNEVKSYVANNASVLFTSGGVIQSKLDNIKNQAHLYGINLDPTLQQTIQHDLIDPTSTRDYNYWNNNMKNLAMDQYKPFAASIKDGSTLYQATYNYRTQMANLLEVAPDNITWNDLMKGAIDPTTGNARTQADFIKQVKTNPLWQKTQNARETYTSLGEDLMRQFGFIG